MVDTCIRKNTTNSHVHCIASNIKRLKLHIDFTPKKNILKKKFYRNINNCVLNKIIVNSSDLPLSTTELSGLNKGLKFVPTPVTVYTRQCIDVALDRFYNRISVAYYFYTNPRPQHGLHRKSNWIAPNPKNRNLLNFFDLLKQDLHIFTNKNPILTDKKNLTSEEELSLVRLSKNKNIVIKKADTGGAIVIMNKCDYIK